MLFCFLKNRRIIYQYYVINKKGEKTMNYFKTSKKLKGTTIIISLLIFLSMFMSVSFMEISISARAETAAEKQIEKSPIEILSYEDIFQSYYDQASEKVTATGHEMCEIEDFSANYYNYETTIQDYTAAVIENAGNPTNLTIAPRSSSADADYILKYNSNAGKNREIYRDFANRGYDDEITPASVFQRDFVCSMFYYGAIKEGDILLETQTVLNNIGHVACIYDLDHKSDKGEYIQTIDCVKGGTQFGFLDDNRMVNFQVKILGVRGVTSAQREDVKYFHYKQLGKEYNLWHAGAYDRLNTDINSEDWYCSEMMYAAYKYAGIDMTDAIGEKGGCWPADIYGSHYTYVNTDYSNSAYLGLSIVDKEGSTWTIKVKNNTAEDINIRYNKKMCFYDDAKEWKGLKDVTEESIEAYKSKNIEVEENWFASSVAFSREYYNNGNRMRLVTFADQLDNNTKTLRIGHSLLEWKDDNLVD